ncbi:MAG TPA: queuosine precursor transporter, partial [Cytophagaceae bacterium]
PSANISLFDKYILDFNLTAGVLIWPVVFITTDIINEYYGKNGVKKVSILTAILIAYAFLIIWLSTIVIPADFWISVNAQAPDGKDFNINYAFTKIFSQGLNIIIGSLTAFLLGQFLDAYIFHYIRHITGSKKIWLRATGSTLVSQLADSFVVLFIAFYVFGGDYKWPLSQIIAVGIINYIYKFSIAILLTPVLYIVHGIIDRYLGADVSETMIEEAEKYN